MPPAGRLAPGLSGVRRGPGGEDGWQRLLPLLALRAVAAVHFRQLEAPGAGKLPTVRWHSFLVPQPEEHPLRRLLVFAGG
jgi:hypothetical protein